MATVQGAATLTGSSLMLSIPASLLALLQAVFEEQQDDLTRRNALAYMLAYEASSLSSDKYGAVVVLNQMWVLAHSLLGQYWLAIPVESRALPLPTPSTDKVQELRTLISGKRNSKGLPQLRG